VLSVSLKVDKIEYRAVIKFFVKEGLTPNEIHSKFIKVYGDSSPSFSTTKKWAAEFKPLKPELNPICYLLALLARHFLHVSRIRVKSLTIRLLMSYIYMEHLFLMFLDHTQRRSTVGRTPLDE